MNTSKNNLEYEIKKQIDEREMAPSRDLWSEIEMQTQIIGDIQIKKTNWFLVAACFILMISLGTVLVFNKDGQSDIQVTQNEPTVKDPMKQPEIETSGEIIQQNNQENIEQGKNTVYLKPENITSKTVIEQQILPVIKENPKEIVSQIPQVSAENIFAKTDSVRVQIKKKRYVDPSTLLFSVEHKDVIETTKDGSNVAKVDLNSK